MFEVTFTRYEEEEGKYICFGYISPDHEDHMRENPDLDLAEETISICTTGEKFNSFDNSKYCTGEFNPVEGAEFTVEADA
jgi:hypothetical protein